MLVAQRHCISPRLLHVEDFRLRYYEDEVRARVSGTSLEPKTPRVAIHLCGTCFRCWP